MYYPEHEGKESLPEPERVIAETVLEAQPHALEPDFVGVFDAIAAEAVKPANVQDRSRIGYWRQAGEDAIRNHDIDGQGYCELGARVRCTITKHAEGLDIVMRPHSIYDERCQMFFVRPMSPDGSWEQGALVLRTSVLETQVSEESEIPLLDELDERQVQALYVAIATPSVER